MKKNAAPSGVTTLTATRLPCRTVLLVDDGLGEFRNCRTCLSGHAGWPAKGLRGKAHACRMLAKRSHLKISGHKKATCRWLYW